LQALRSLGGTALFHGWRPSSSQGAPFWPSGLTVRRSRPPTAAAELRALAKLILVSQIEKMDPQVSAAIITAVGSVLAAVIAAVAAIFVGRVFLSREKLKSQLDAAVADIAFLLKVEERHCELHQDSSGQSNKQRVRDHVQSAGNKWSGRFTPGRYRSNSNAV